MTLNQSSFLAGLQVGYRLGRPPGRDTHPTPPSDDRMITEDDERMITESEDYMETE